MTTSYYDYGEFSISHKNDNSFNSIPPELGDFDFLFGVTAELSRQ